MDIKNLVKLYTSKYIRTKTMTEQQKRKKLDTYIDRIAQQRTEGDKRILEVSITPQYDIILGFEHRNIAEFYAEQGFYRIPTKDPEYMWCIPAGPVISQGLINYHNYELHCRYPPPGMSKHVIADYLDQIGVKVLELELNNGIDGSGRAYMRNGLQIYARFGSLEEALNFPMNHEIEGHIMKLWHKGMFICEICGNKGHTAEKHEWYMAIVERDREKRRRYRARKSKN